MDTADTDALMHGEIHTHLHWLATGFYADPMVGFGFEHKTIMTTFPDEDTWWAPPPLVSAPPPPLAVPASVPAPRIGNVPIAAAEDTALESLAAVASTAAPVVLGPIRRPPRARNASGQFASATERVKKRMYRRKSDATKTELKRLGIKRHIAESKELSGVAPKPSRSLVFKSTGGTRRVDFVTDKDKKTYVVATDLWQLLRGSDVARKSASAVMRDFESPAEKGAIRMERKTRDGRTHRQSGVNVLTRAGAERMLAKSSGHSIAIDTFVRDTILPALC